MASSSFWNTLLDELQAKLQREYQLETNELRSAFRINHLSLYNSGLRTQDVTRDAEAIETYKEISNIHLAYDKTIAAQIGKIHTAWFDKPIYVAGPGGYKMVRAMSSTEESETEQEETAEIESLLSQIKQASSQVADRLDSIHNDISSMVAFSRAARLNKE